jgi:ectoine hydroxylase-related dioxygenase (phytanoyl-CoA dioxygenase family)
MLHTKKYLNGESGPENRPSVTTFGEGTPGEVFMFPSWLEHAVSQNLTDNPRISISCNFLIGTMEEKEKARVALNKNSF